LARNALGGQKNASLRVYREDRGHGAKTEAGNHFNVSTRRDILQRVRKDVSVAERGHNKYRFKAF
jgi:hypothetical protein